LLAKCSRCAQTFQTERFGEQFCPFCGARVLIANPAGSATPNPSSPNASSGPSGTPGTSGTPGVAGADGPQDQEAPIDRPEANGGLLPAFAATWKKSVFDPGAFYGRLRVGNDWGGALIFALLCLVAGGVLVGLLQSLEFPLQMKAQMNNWPPEFRDKVAPYLNMGPLLSIGFALGLPVLALVGLFFQAGVLHLALRILGAAGGGFNATFRAVAFAQGPYLFGLVPICGATVGGVWTLVLVVIGLSKMHRISIGQAVGAYALLFLSYCCCCGVPLVGGVGVTSAMVADQQRAAAYDAREKYEQQREEMERKEMEREEEPDHDSPGEP
jgi:hypothetical protein